jgi:hypothetical protein
LESCNLRLVGIQSGFLILLESCNRPAIYMACTSSIEASKIVISNLLSLSPTSRRLRSKISPVTMDRGYELCSLGPATLGPRALDSCPGERVLPGFVFAGCVHQSGLREILPPHRVCSGCHSCRHSLISRSGFSSRVCFLQSALARFLFLPVSTTFTRDFHFDLLWSDCWIRPGLNLLFYAYSVCSVFPFEDR